MEGKELDLVEPSYIKEFACLGGDCPDTCCANWDIAFDAAACARYAASSDAEIREGYETAVQRNAEPVADGTVPYAFVKLTAEQGCAFLEPDGFCRIQRRTAEKNLSQTCRTYPRVWHTWGDAYAECSMDVSCPLAAQLILGRKSALQFSTEKLPAEELTGYRLETPRKTADPTGLQLRNFMIFLLQQPAFSIEERLLLANRFFWEAAVPARAASSAIDALVDRYIQLTAAPPRVRELLGRGTAQLASQLDVLRLLLYHRLQMPAAPMSATFTAAADRAVQRWQLGEAVPVHIENARRYQADIVQWERFISRHSYMVENYLVNQVFKTICFTGRPSDGMRWLQLVFQFALHRLLLTAAAGTAGAAFTEAQAIALMQKTAKAVEHNAAYLQQAAKFLRILQMDQADGMETLIRVHG